MNSGAARCWRWLRTSSSDGVGHMFDLMLRKSGLTPARAPRPIKLVAKPRHADPNRDRATTPRRLYMDGEAPPVGPERRL